MAFKDNVYVIRLFGGLGNQMFQYSLGRRLADETGREVRFDVENGFRRDVYGRRFALESLKTEIVLAASRDIPVGMNWPNPWYRIASAAWSAMPGPWRRVIYERRPFHFDKTVASGAKGRAYYFGYWQNRGYFSSIEPLLRQEFTLRVPLRVQVLALMKEMRGCLAVSVHVRRNHGIGTDGRVMYEAREQFGTYEADYYQRAVELIRKESGTVCCYVFTDNPEWTKAHLRLPVPCRYVADQGRFSDQEEMLLMASCRHHVISNSTFSWWGAWLGDNPAKIVVAPQRWMTGVTAESIDIYPAEWHRI